MFNFLLIVCYSLSCMVLSWPTVFHGEWTHKTKTIQHFQFKAENSFIVKSVANSCWSVGFNKTRKVNIWVISGFCSSTLMFLYASKQKLRWFSIRSVPHVFFFWCETDSIAQNIISSNHWQFCRCYPSFKESRGLFKQSPDVSALCHTAKCDGIVFQSCWGKNNSKLKLKKLLYCEQCNCYKASSMATLSNFDILSTL